jgi:GT2 family glycosyltransferase
LKIVDVLMVTFYSDLSVLSKVLERLKEAAGESSDALIRVTIVDNSCGRDHPYFEDLKMLVSRVKFDIDLRQAPSNLGFGRANNLAFDHAFVKTQASDYVLALNPDAFLSLNSLKHALQSMNQHLDVGLLLPRFLSESGEDLYLAKRYPSVWVLFLRGFAPSFIKKIFQSFIDAYDLKDLPPDQSHLQTIVASGACFLMRTSIWKQLQGFDPRFFLYFEDFDLSYRAKQITKVLYEPSVEVIHLGGHTAKKGRMHIKYFIRSAGQFFNKNGWKLF